MNKINAVFITGTCTGVGKTVVTGLLGRLLKEKGIRAVTQKWVQTGCSEVTGDIMTHAMFMKRGKDVPDKYRPHMTPYVLDFPSSPHLAALLEKKRIDPAIIENAFHRLSTDFEFVLVEGSGGLMVPINDKEMIVDIVERLRLPVLVVAENKLGAINHTLLTVEALRKRDLSLAGVIFNRLSDEGNEVILKDNLRVVESLAGADVLGELRHEKNIDVLFEAFRPIGERVLDKLGLA
ncbi:dethiobiotin synthase [Candidatus Omnitrophota bacterium]